MDFRILGPLEVVGDDGPVTLHRGKEQALLSFMLLHPNELLPSDRLIDELWDGRPPATAAKILQNTISQLRRALDAGRLETRPPGYVFHLADDELDVDRFERLAKAGRAAEALTLWRGTPLVELRDERFADDARRRLEEQRMDLLERRIDDDLNAGRHAQLVPELEALAAQHPLRERVHVQLMRALYASGRQADALDAYRRARRTLREELGLDPSPELQEFERRILTQDPQLAPARPPSTPRMRPRRRWPLLAGALAIALGAAIAGVLIATSGGKASLVATPNTLAVVDPKSGRVEDVLPIGRTPRGVTVGRRYVWTANAGDGTITEIDPQKPAVVQTIGLGASATDLVEAAGRLWVATGADDTVVRIDALTAGILGTTPLRGDESASAYAIAADAHTVWVGSGNDLIEFDPKSEEVVRALHFASGINNLAVALGSLWVVSSAETVARISTSAFKVRAKTSIGQIPSSLAVFAGSVWVGAQEPHGLRAAIWRLDHSLQVTQTTPFGKPLTLPPPTVHITVGDGALWASNYDDGLVVRIDPQSGLVTKTIRVGSHPSGIAFGRGKLWVTVS